MINGNKKENFNFSAALGLPTHRSFRWPTRLHSITVSASIWLPNMALRKQSSFTISSTGQGTTESLKEINTIGEPGPIKPERKFPLISHIEVPIKFGDIWILLFQKKF